LSAGADRVEIEVRGVARDGGGAGNDCVGRFAERQLAGRRRKVALVLRMLVPEIPKNRDDDDS